MPRISRQAKKRAVRLDIGDFEAKSLATDLHELLLLRKEVYEERISGGYKPPISELIGDLNRNIALFRECFAGREPTFIKNDKWRLIVARLIQQVRTALYSTNITRLFVHCENQSQIFAASCTGLPNFTPRNAQNCDADPFVLILLNFLYPITKIAEKWVYQTAFKQVKTYGVMTIDAVSRRYRKGCPRKARRCKLIVSCLCRAVGRLSSLWGNVRKT